jgi:arsenate reductase
MAKTVLFVCVHNAGRSQMAEAFLNTLAAQHKLDIRGTSAGTLGAGEINPLSVQVMAELGISLATHFPKTLTPEMVNQADKVISMGCGVDAVACPARFVVTEDWGLEDPAGQPIDRVREIRNQIREKVEDLLRREESL